MPYQSFGDRAGSSKSNEKMGRIGLPRKLDGKRVLDLGCNEGFFCMEAKRRGAAYVLGIDANPKAIEQARERSLAEGLDIKFTVCDFRDVSEQQFDLILMLSALHYADDPKSVLGHVYQLLSPKGQFILEYGVADEGGRKMRRVLRSIDERYFPSLELLRDDWLANFAVRRMGRSVLQAGDPMPRYVFHCTKRKPTLVLIWGNGGAGKTTIARHFTQPLLIETDAIISPLRNESRAVVSSQQLTMDEVLRKHNNHIGNAWDQLRADPGVVKYFADVVGKMVKLNLTHDLVVIEGYMVRDLAAALEVSLRDSHVVWNLSAGGPSAAMTSAVDGRRGRVRLNGDSILGWVPAMSDAATPQVEILQDGEQLLMVKAEWFCTDTKKIDQTHFRIGLAELAAEGATGNLTFRAHLTKRELKGSPIDLRVRMTSLSS